MHMMTDSVLFVAFHAVLCVSLSKETTLCPSLQIPANSLLGYHLYVRGGHSLACHISDLRQRAGREPERADDITDDVAPPGQFRRKGEQRMSQHRCQQQARRALRSHMTPHEKVRLPRSNQSCKGTRWTGTQPCLSGTPLAVQ